MNARSHRLSLPLIFLLIALLLAACSGGDEPPPTPVPTTIPPSVSTPTSVAPETESVWDRIQAAGKIVVGTSADYPPFASYTSNFELYGYDIALIEAIGEELGLEVEIKDFAFDGLAGALEIGQIDAAIAAISVTQERDLLVDFSDSYYVGEDAVLAAANSAVGEIRSSADLADKTVAVQHASVYESWLEDELVEPGLMPAENLLSYGNINQALRDLEANHFDVLVLDKLPAEEAVLAGDFRIVGKGLNRQRFAIAMPNGSDTLRREINFGLRTLQRNGVVAALAKEHLGLEDDEIIIPPTPAPELPTPTPAPAATSTPVPVPTPGCVDGAAWVADLNYNDNNMSTPPQLAPGQSFSKGWRLRNSGACEWNQNYSIQYAHGNSPLSQMGGVPAPVSGSVAPGATQDLYVNLIAPQSPGIYQGFWQMHNDKGVAFGQRVWVGIQVPAPATPTAIPTTPPSPQITFTVDRTQIRQGECVTFSWNVQNVKEVYFFREGEDWQNNGVPGVDQRSACPQYTSTHFLRVVHHDNRVEQPGITIYVEAASVPPPNISYFSTEPQDVLVGGCTIMRWEVLGDTHIVNVYSDGTPLWSSAPLRGSLQDCPPKVGYITYAVEASGPGGTARSESTVSVLKQPR